MGEVFRVALPKNKDKWPTIGTQEDMGGTGSDEKKEFFFVVRRDSTHGMRD